MSFPRLTNHYQEIPAASWVITMGNLPEPQFCRVSKPNQCDDAGFLWVEGVGEPESDCGPGTRTWRAGCGAERVTTANNGGMACLAPFVVGGSGEK